ncbi:MAG: DUF6183 family protein [Planctomycetota bacterium]
MAFARAVRRKSDLQFAFEHHSIDPTALSRRQLARLLQALHSQDGMEAWKLAWLGREVVNRLIFKGSPAALRSAIEIALQPPEYDAVSLTERLVGCVRPAGLRQLIAECDSKAETRDLAALLLHTAIVAGESWTSDVTAQRIQRRLRRAGHPWGSLPLQLEPTESTLPEQMPMMAPSGARVRAVEDSRCFTAPNGPGCEEDSSSPHRILETTSDHLVRDLTRWCEPGVSNWVFEARSFNVGATTRITAGLLSQLVLECAAGAAPAQFQCRTATARDVIHLLFEMAAFGGAYGLHRGAPDGRVLTWRTLAALVGASRWLPATVMQKAHRYQFASFIVPSSSFWFDVAWDYGIAALGPRGRLVVLAASDTD